MPSTTRKKNTMYPGVGRRLFVIKRRKAERIWVHLMCCVIGPCLTSPMWAPLLSYCHSEEVLWQPQSSSSSRRDRNDPGRLITHVSRYVFSQNLCVHIVMESRGLALASLFQYLLSNFMRLEKEDSVPLQISADLTWTLNAYSVWTIPSPME